MKNQDFTPTQICELGNFLKIYKNCRSKKINPSFLLYLICKDEKENMYSKSNVILLRDTLPKKQRFQLDFLLRKKKY